MLNVIPCQTQNKKHTHERICGKETTNKVFIFMNDEGGWKLCRKLV